MILKKLLRELICLSTLIINDPRDIRSLIKEVIAFLFDVSQEG